MLISDKSESIRNKQIRLVHLITVHKPLYVSYVCFTLGQLKSNLFDRERKQFIYQSKHLT